MSYPIHPLCTVFETISKVKEMWPPQAVLVTNLHFSQASKVVLMYACQITGQHLLIYQKGRASLNVFFQLNFYAVNLWQIHTFIR